MDCYRLSQSPPKYAWEVCPNLFGWRFSESITGFDGYIYTIAPLSYNQFAVGGVYWEDNGLSYGRLKILSKTQDGGWKYGDEMTGTRYYSEGIGSITPLWDNQFAVIGLGDVDLSILSKSPENEWEIGKKSPIWFESPVYAATLLSDNQLAVGGDICEIRVFTKTQNGELSILTKSSEGKWELNRTFGNKAIHGTIRAIIPLSNNQIMVGDTEGELNIFSNIPQTFQGLKQAIMDGRLKET